jgi:C4-type Zn-finger protein
MKCPKCGMGMVDVEYTDKHPFHFDGVSEYYCPTNHGGCGYRQGKWSDKELLEGEFENWRTKKGEKLPNN